MSTLTSQDILDLARRTLAVEAEALNNMATLLGEEFISAVNSILECSGKLIITGMGKSGLAVRLQLRWRVRVHRAFSSTRVRLSTATWV